MIITTFAAAAAAAALIATGAYAQSDTGGRKLQTSLTGAAELPSPGDPDGAGTAKITVNPGQNQICYKLAVSNIAPATMAHIHEGASTAAGPVVVTLGAPTSGTKSGCVKVTRALALEILKAPSDYYVNVHNPAFPGGAVRGQLTK